MASNQYTSSDKVVVIDVSDKPATSKIVREGYAVPPVPINKSTAEFFVASVPPTAPTESPRVVLQSIAAGTKVVVGTSVDLVLAPPSMIPTHVIDSVHADLAETQMSDLTTGALADSKTRQALLKYDQAESVNEADKAYLTGVFQEYHDVQIDESDVERTFERAFNTMKGALAYK